MYDQLAPYYDEIYANKDYKNECVDLIKIFKLNSFEPHTILDIGCGTGTHAAMLKSMGYDVHGIDISEGMIEVAQKKYPHGWFRVEDIRNMVVEEERDAIISMFATMSYLAKPGDFTAALRNVRKALKPGGLFIFDGWNKSAVNAASRPNGKIKDLGEGLLKYTEMYTSENKRIATNKFMLMDMNSGLVIKDESPLLLFDQYFLADLFSMEGFKLVDYWKSYSMSEPNVTDWKVTVVARKLA